MAHVSLNNRLLTSSIPGNYTYKLYLLPFFISHLPWSLSTKLQWAQKLCNFNITEGELKQKETAFSRRMHWGCEQSFREQAFPSNFDGKKTRNVILSNSNEQGYLISILASITSLQMQREENRGRNLQFGWHPVLLI